MGPAHHAAERRQTDNVSASPPVKATISTHLSTCLFDLLRGVSLRSTRKAFGAEKGFAITSIVYIQIGTEELSEAHEAMEEPLKTMSGDPRSLFISAGESSVRIRLRDAETATELAERLRAMIDEEPVTAVPTGEEST